MLNRFRIPEIVLGAYLTISVFAIGFVFGSLPHFGQAAEQQRTDKPGETGDSHKEQKNWWNDATADFTLGLVFVGLAQAGLFYVQLRLIRESLAPAKEAAAAAKEAADAAKLNAQAVVDADRARIFVTVDQDTTDSIRAATIYINSPEMDDGTISTNIGLFFGFKNYGKTPAIIKEMSAQVMLAPELPKEREYVIRSPLPFDHILAAGERTELQTLLASLDHKINLRTAKAIQSLVNTVWFYGYISYDDTFGWGRELRFIFNYNGGTGGRFRLYSYREIQSAKRHEDS